MTADFNPQLSNQMTRSEIVAATKVLSPLGYNAKQFFANEGVVFKGITNSYKHETSVTYSKKGVVFTCPSGFIKDKPEVVEVEIYRLFLKRWCDFHAKRKALNKGEVYEIIGRDANGKVVIEENDLRFWGDVIGYDDDIEVRSWLLKHTTLLIPSIDDYAAYREANKLYLELLAVKKEIAKLQDENNDNRCAIRVTNYVTDWLIS